MKTSELTGPALDWAVAKCGAKSDCVFKHTTADLHVQFDGPESGVVVHAGEGVEWNVGEYCREWSAAQFPGLLEHEWNYTPSTNWSQGGPIIERENISLAGKDPLHDCWAAMTQYGGHKQDGPTPLIAAMRCYCCSKLGDEIDIPEELCQSQNS